MLLTSSGINQRIQNRGMGQLGGSRISMCGAVQIKSARFTSQLNLAMDTYI